MKLYGGVEINSTILYLGTKMKVISQPHAPVTLPPGKEPQLPIG
jgi:hypothetical protein